LPSRFRPHIGIGAPSPRSPIDSVSSPHSKRAYEKALKDFFAWYSAEARPPLSRAVVQQHRSVLESASLAPASINLRLSAIRKLAAEAAENDLLDRSVAQGIMSLKGVRQSGDREGTGSPGNRRATWLCGVI